MSGEHVWDARRPQDGQRILVWSVPAEGWFPYTYWEDGIDGVLEGEEYGELAEIDEYGDDVLTKWREVEI